MADVLRDGGERERMLAEWEMEARKLPGAAELPRPALRDSLPQVLDSIASHIEGLAGGEAGDVIPEDADRHALERLAEGFDLPQVVQELSLLRDCVLRLCLAGDPSAIEQQRVFNRAIDHVIGVSARRFSEAHARTINVIDRIMRASYEATSLDELLRMLITAFNEETPAVDTMTIYLRQNGKLRLRAATGLEASSVGFTLDIGEGFAGRVAAERRALEISAAAEDPNVRNAPIREGKVLALHGVPLIDSDDLIGVACMGSLSITEFSAADRILFASMATRASAGIGYHMLRETSDRRARALAASDKRFRDTFENAAIGIGHVALDGRWLHVNEHFCDLFRYTEAELLRMRLADVMHPDDLRSATAGVERLISGELDRYAAEHRYIRKDGETGWMDLTLSLAGEDADGDRGRYFIAAAHDVSARIRLHEHLAFLTEASALLASTLDYARTLDHVAMLAVPRLADWCIVDLLEHVEGRAGRAVVAHKDPQRAETLREWRDHPPLGGNAAGTAKVLRTGSPMLLPEVDDERLREIAGSDAPLDELRSLGLRSAVIYPLTVDGRKIGALTLAQAESERRFGPEDLGLLHEVALIASTALRNAMLHSETRRAVRLRDRVLGIVSHDLRNPLGTISLTTSLLWTNQSIRDDPAVGEQVEIIERNVQRATRLIDDLLDMSSVQAGELAIERTETLLEPVLREAVESERAAAHLKDIELIKELGTVRTCVLGDRDRLLQVLGNVIGNAVKYCEPGSRVTVRSEVAGEEALIRVVDNGPGIPPETLEHVFDAYVRVERGERGTGLGLFIAKGIVEAHGGRIWIESAPGSGTSLHVALPLASPARSAGDAGS